MIFDGLVALFSSAGGIYQPASGTPSAVLIITVSKRALNFEGVSQQIWFFIGFETRNARKAANPKSTPKSEQLVMTIISFMVTIRNRDIEHCVKKRIIFVEQSYLFTFISYHSNPGLVV